MTEQTHPDRSGEDDASFVERIARPLRTREHTDDTFNARVMSAIHADVRAQASVKSESWWLRRRTFSLSPLAGLALAAGIAGLVFGVARMQTPVRTVETAAAPSVDTVQMVRFVFMDSSARAVSLVGDFNGWDKTQTPLTRGETRGTWTVKIALPNGRHEYAFIVRGNGGEHWVTDPFAATEHDEFGTESSTLTVGPPVRKQVTGAS